MKMHVDVEVLVHAPKTEVWKIVTDIENAAARVSGIDAVEILERPAAGLVGLKWKETRTLFGKSATEVMWITEAEDGSWYSTEARSHGAIYRTRIEVEEVGADTRLRGRFESEPRTFGARVMATLLGGLVKGATRKALLQDLEDAKRIAEGQATGPAGEPA